ncbi:hypothetical protein ACUUL3_05425 [Thiovibrio sp. JS02]
MAEKIEEKIERLLQEGKSRLAILSELKGKEDPQKLLFYINNVSRPADRKKYQVHNLALVLVLTFVTTKKLITAFSFGALDLFLLISLVVPVINIYLLREILRFRKIGYQFLFVLSILSVLHPENHFPREAALLGSMIGLSGFLYFKMFPKKERITEIAD